MSTDERLEGWRRDEAAPMSGWDFSYLSERQHSEEPPWDYEEIARDLLRRSRSVLEMATGGGEVFASLAPFHRHTVAIEGFKPNVAVARARLEPLGVRVVECGEVATLPFADATFDLVLNRHGGLRVREIHRVLASGGHFLTQQVGGDHLADLLAAFGARPQWPENVLQNRQAELLAAGFDVVRSEEWRGRVTYADVGAVVYLLRSIPWLVPGFTVDSHLAGLMALQERHDSGEPLRFTASRFLIVAAKRQAKSLSG